MEIDVPIELLVGFSLAMVRTAAWMVVCPPFNSPAVPVRIRIGLATAISFLLARSLAPTDVDLSAGPFFVALLTQAFAGLALGFAVYVLFAAIQAAGDLIDLQVGYSLGSVLDPISGSMAAPIGRFHQLMAITILFAINGHVLVVRGFIRSVEAVPLGTFDLGRLAATMLDLLAVFFAAAVEIGLPVLAALFLAEIAIGLIGKAAPQMNVLILGFAIKSIAAFALLGMTLALLPEATESLLGQSVRAIARAFGG